MSRTLLLSAIVALGCSVSSVPAASDIEKAIVQSIMLNQIGLLVDDPNMIFGLIDGPKENLKNHRKIIFGSIEDLSIPLDRAHRVASDTSIFRIDTVNMGSFYSNMLRGFH